MGLIKGYCVEDVCVSGCYRRDGAKPPSRSHGSLYFAVGCVPQRCARWGMREYILNYTPFIGTSRVKP